MGGQITVLPTFDSLAPLPRINRGIAYYLNGLWRSGFLDGSFTIGGDGQISAGASTALDGTWAFAIADSVDNVIFGVTRTGEVMYVDQGSPAVTTPTINSFQELNHIFSYGQSLSIGFASEGPISTTQRFNALMSSSGMFDTTFPSLAPMVQSVDETPVQGMADAIAERIIAEQRVSSPADIDFTVLGSAPGVSGVSVAYLSKGAGTGAYERVTSSCTNAKAAAAAINKTYGVFSVTWTQGEEDMVEGTDPAVYTTAVKKLFSDLNTDLSAITLQTQPFPVVMYQVASWKRCGAPTPAIGLAQDAMCTNSSLLFLACPAYFFEYTDGLHLTGVSYKWMGAYYGRALKRILLDGFAWAPLRCTEAVAAGTSIIAKFNVPTAPLVLDTVNVSDPGNYGFNVVNSSGTDISISSVDVISENRVKIQTSAPIPTGCFLRYGWNGTETTGRTTGPRGCLRDSDPLIFDPTNLNLPMYNWCTMFQYQIS